MEEFNPMSITATFPVQRRADLKVHEIDDEALIYDPVTADTHRMNSTAYFIWRCFDDAGDVEGMARTVTETYEVSLFDARVQVERMWREFHERGLMVAPTSKSSADAAQIS